MRPHVWYFAVSGIIFQKSIIFFLDCKNKLEKYRDYLNHKVTIDLILKNGGSHFS